jgi:hypothetical protein
MRAPSPVVLCPRPDVIPDQARDVRARAWKFVFDTYARKNPAAGPSERGEDGTKVKEDSASAIISN